MAAFNKVFLMGNLTRDPELRVTPTGTPICQFGIATTHTWNDRSSGQKREDVCFVDVEAWGKQGEVVAKYLAKGRPIFIEGRLKFDQWEDKATGSKRSKLKVVLESFQFIGSKSDGAAATGDTRPVGQETQSRPAFPQQDMDEDVPF